MRDPCRHDRVRSTEVQVLKSRGFDVWHDPKPLNPDHALVEHETGSGWTDCLQEAFDTSFEATGGGMSDKVTLVESRMPWKPSDGVSDETVLNYYDMPLAGIFSQQGHRYLFLCVAGQLERSNLWIYVLLQKDQEDRIMHLDGPGEVAACLRKLTSGVSTVLALAIDREIVADTEMVVGERGFDAEALRCALTLLEGASAGVDLEEVRAEIACS